MRALGSVARRRKGLTRLAYGDGSVSNSTITRTLEERSRNGRVMDGRYTHSALLLWSRAHRIVKFTHEDEILQRGVFFV